MSDEQKIEKREVEGDKSERSPAKKWFNRAFQAVFYLAAIGLFIGMLYSPQSKMKGKAAPVFETVDYRGRPVSLADLRGRVVVLDFWGTWCPHCVRMIPKLRNIRDDYRKKGVTVIGIHSADGLPDRANMLHYMKKSKINYAIWNSTAQIERDYMIQSWPTMFIIDQRGRIKDILRGAQGERKIRKILDGLLQGN